MHQIIKPLYQEGLRKLTELEPRAFTILWVGQYQKSKLTILYTNEARDDGVAMASAGPYANHLHLIL